jgi:hypothetical protein
MGRKENAAPKACQVRVSINALQNIDEITGSEVKLSKLSLFGLS